MRENFRGRVIFTASVGAAAIAGLFIVWNGRYILLLLFAGVIGAILLSIFVHWLQSRLRLRRSLAFLIVMLGTVGFLSALVLLRGPALLQQLNALQGDLPQAAHEIMARLSAAPWGRWMIDQIAGSARTSDGFSVALSGLRGVMSATIFTVAALVLVMFVSLFLAAEPDFYLRGLLRLTPVRHRSLLRECLASAQTSLESWLVARLLSMVIIGCMVAAGLWILRVPLPGTLGSIAGLLTFIPNVGPVISVIPAALLAFAISPGRGLLTLALFGLVHFLEGHVVTPLAERKIVTLPPALTISLQLLLASMTGLLGIAMAAPITAVLLAVMNVILPADRSVEIDKVEGSISACVRTAASRSSPV